MTDLNQWRKVECWRNNETVATQQILTLSQRFCEFVHLNCAYSADILCTDKSKVKGHF